jgi:decaprenylphospho-beta-D-ribofuranose 2-oxidase
MKEQTTRTRSATAFQPLPVDRLTLLEGWGMVSRALGYVYRPSTIEGVRAVLQLARESGRSLVPRGTGYSYGDVSLNAEHIVLDLTRMNRILDWQPETGVIRVEPGVTVHQLWRYVLEDGWWPVVVPGAMYPTVGGCAATNVHGKNNWRVGPIGACILAAELLLPSGETITCGPDDHSELFHAAIGGLGMLGIFLSLTLRLERVRSGLLRVQEFAAPALDELFTIFEQNLERADYLIGWIDGFATGQNLGRGLVQIARHVEHDPNAHVTLRADYQELPDTMLGILPRSRLWLAMKPTVNDLGMRALNTARYALGARRSGRVRYTPHAQFHFFHDFVPNWKRSWQPGGLLEYQVFVPEANARAVFATLLEESQRAGLIPYLVVFKRHRADAFLLSYSVDGYSLALDYHITTQNEHRLRTMLAGFTHDVVLPASGRFYPAKDNVLDSASAVQSFGRAAVARYLALKRELDPQNILQSNFYRRLFAPVAL